MHRVVSDATEDPVEDFPRTLEGLLAALERAKWLSWAGAPRQVLAGDRVICRFEGGREPE